MRSVPSSFMVSDAEMKFDLWLPTANPMTTFDLLEEAAARTEA
jgi:hypothetical protein